MENASKALIIAGAILISILLISVGILVMNSTGDVQDQMQQQMSATEKSSFNAQFTSYEGENRSASQVKSLYNQVQSSNATNSYQVVLHLPVEPVSKLSSRNKYNVDMDRKDGVITTITVTQVGSSNTVNP